MVFYNKKIIWLQIISLVGIVIFASMKLFWPVVALVVLFNLVSIINYWICKRDTQVDTAYDGYNPTKDKMKNKKF